MANLTTNYMGLDLKNPVIIGANNMVTNPETVKKWESEGAAAIVYKSLFEEQIQLENLEMSENIDEFSERNPEMISTFPNVEHAGPKEHLYKLKKVKDAVNIPVIASLNAIYKETWIEYAKELENTGIDALELNFYAVPVDFNKIPEEIESHQEDVLKSIKQAVKIPVSVKLSHSYTNPLHFIHKLDQANADALVLFNRFFQPDIDITNEQHFFPYDLSSPTDSKVALRFAGLLYDNVNAHICANSGIYSGNDVVKVLLAGANAVQIVSTVYKNKSEIIGRIINELESWMDSKGYKNIEDFRGKLSRKSMKDPFAYKRAQYIDILLNSQQIFKKYPMA